MVAPRRTADAGRPGPAGVDHQDAPTQPLSLASGGERCVNCGAPLASDQRYCVNCGERRGKPRFEVADGSPPAAEYTAVTTTTGPPPPQRTRTSTGLNLIAGVATLLLAVGVGVLIGHNGAGSARNASAPSRQVIKVGGGSGNGATTAANSGGSSSGGGGTKSHHAATSKAGKAHAAAATKAPPKVVQKAGAAASKVTGGSAKVANPTVTQGASCSSGQAGCQNGKFTGNNFGQ